MSSPADTTQQPEGIAFEVADPLLDYDSPLLVGPLASDGTRDMTGLYMAWEHRLTQRFDTVGSLFTTGDTLSGVAQALNDVLELDSEKGNLARMDRPYIVLGVTRDGTALCVGSRHSYLFTTSVWEQEERGDFKHVCRNTLLPGAITQYRERMQAQ